MNILPSISIAVIGLALASATAQAQIEQGDSTQATTNNNNNITVLSEWQYDPIYGSNGIRAEYLLNIEVFGPAGEEIGNVEDAIISQGEIVAIVAEVGGFWDIGDVHIAVPWKEVELVQDGVVIPVSEGNFEQYALYNETSYVNQGYLDGVTTGLGAVGAAAGARCPQAGGDGQSDKGLVSGACGWRLTALVNDYVVLPDGTGYGYLEDVIFSQDGEIQAIVVESTLAGYDYGTYAYPFYGYGGGWAWNPYSPVYTLPYGVNEIGALEPFQYDMFNGFWY